MVKKKVPVFKKKGDVFVPVGEMDEEAVKELIADPDVVEVEAVLIEEDEMEAFLEQDMEEKRIHEFKAEEIDI